MAAPLSCAVIGGGVMGAAAALHLARRDATVQLFEQFDLFHAQGSSHGPTRLFRMAYFEHPDYAPLLKRADEGWRALQAACGETLFHRTGVLLAGPGDSALISGTLKASKEHGLSVDSLTAREARTRFPWFDLPADFEFLIEPAGGVIRADRALAAFIDGARAAGATPAAGVKVLAWSPARDGVEVATADGKRTFDRLVIAPGSWASLLLGDVGTRVKPLRKFLFWMATNDPALAIDFRFLPFAVERRDRRMFYGFPAIDADGVKIGEHTGGVPLSTPNESAPSNEARADLGAFLREFAPGLPGRITKEQSCLYAMSPDGHFMIDMHPADPRVVFAAGFSGHGFKFAPVIGEALADLALDGETLREFDFLKLARFSGKTSKQVK